MLPFAYSNGSIDLSPRDSIVGRAFTAAMGMHIRFFGTVRIAIRDWDPNGSSTWRGCGLVIWRRRDWWKLHTPRLHLRRQATSTCAMGLPDTPLTGSAPPAATQLVGVLHICGLQRRATVHMSWGPPNISRLAQRAMRDKSLPKNPFGVCTAFSNVTNKRSFR